MRKFLEKLKIPKRKQRMLETSRIVNKRWKLLMSWMQPMGSETKEEVESKQILTKGHLRKYNLRCDCGMCSFKPLKTFGQKKLESMSDQIEL